MSDDIYKNYSDTEKQTVTKKCSDHTKSSNSLRGRDKNSE
jgi:hypothetical protein